MITVFHIIDHTFILCEPIERKRKSLFPKYWCSVCKRYVLPDGNKHFWTNTIPKEFYKNKGKTGTSGKRKFKEIS